MVADVRASFATTRISARDRRVEPAFQVVIAYEDSYAGLRAMDACKLLLSQLDGEADFRTLMWTFDSLRNVELNQMAADDAVDADVVIIASSRNADLPREMKQWIESWLPLKCGQTAVLVALMVLANNGSNASAAARDYLKRAAAEAEIDFLFQIKHLDEDGTRLSDCMTPPAPEGWGLND
jgi:hypothetical protein